MSKKNKKKIVFITGTRADYGKIKPLIFAVNKSKIYEPIIFVTGMHLQRKYGYTISEIKNDFKNLISICKKYKIYKRIFQEQLISFVNLIKQSEKLNGDKYYLDDGIKDSFIIATTNKIKIYLDLSHNNNLVLLTIFKNLYLTLFKKK